MTTPKPEPPTVAQIVAELRERAAINRREQARAVDRAAAAAFENAAGELESVAYWITAESDAPTH
jgi:hypothetical protein